MLVWPKNIVFLATKVFAGSWLTRLTSLGELHMHTLVAKVRIVKKPLRICCLILSFKADEGETSRHLGGWVMDNVAAGDLSILRKCHAKCLLSDFLRQVSNVENRLFLNDPITFIS